MNFFKRIYKSVTDFNAYKEFYLESVGKAISYLIKVCLIISVILSFVFTCKYIMPMGEFIKEEVPNFKFENNELTAEEQTYMEKEFGLFIVDTFANIANNEYKEEIETQDNCYMFLKDGVVIKVDGNKIIYNYNEFPFKEIPLENNREEINGKFYLYIYLVLIPILMLYFFSKTLIYALMITIIIYITRRMLQIDLNFSNILNITIYGFTLPLFLELICILLYIFANFMVYSYNTMIIIIGYIYTITALFSIRRELQKLSIDYKEYQKKVNEDKENKE